MAEFGGSLFDYVTIERWVAGSGSGSGSGSWSAGGGTWAALEPIVTVVTADIGERQLGRPRFRLTVRAPTSVGLGTRCLWRGRTLVVLRLEPDPRQRDRASFLVEDRT